MYTSPNVSNLCRVRVYSFELPTSMQKHPLLQILPGFPGGEDLDTSFGDTVKRVRAKRYEGGTTDSRVSSNWALRLPSIVVAVQLSGQWISSQFAPRLSICQA